MLWVALAAYLAGLAVALLSPTSGVQSALVTHVCDFGVRLGLSPETATQGRGEFLCNALILMPVSMLGSAVWPRTNWRDWLAFSFVISGSVELAQGLLLPERSATYVDVLANTLGGLAGALVVTAVRALVRSRRSAARERRQELH